jgi:IS66 Orf2 like protein
MLSFPAAIKVHRCTLRCDMRRSFDGLSMMAEHIIRCNPFSGHLLVLCNRRSDRVKTLYWDRDGWAIWYKRSTMLLQISSGSASGPSSKWRFISSRKGSTVSSRVSQAASEGSK